MSKREDAATLYLYVKDYIMKLLVSGDYPPNSKLPTEFELMDELNVGRATVREALARLENEGFIYRKQGLGTFVKEADGFSIHPFASFTYTANSLGFEDRIEVISENEFEVNNETKDTLCNWDIGTKGKTIFRKRLIENASVALDHVFISEDTFDIIGKNIAYTESLAQKLSQCMNSGIDHIKTDVYKRLPTKDELDLLHVNEDEDVVEVRRWLYASTISKKPIAFSVIVISSRLFKLQTDFRSTKK